MTMLQIKSSSIRKPDIYRLQAEMMKAPQEEIEVKHHFADGCYAREMHVKAGVALVGAEHKTNHHWVLSKGSCRVVSNGVKITIKAPHHGITNPGDKRAIYAISDIVWTTFHVTNKTDVDEISKDILMEVVS